MSYQHDAASRLIQVAQGSLAVGLGYDNANRRTSLGYSNNTTTSYAYDLASRLTGITHNGPSGIIEALTYTYDTAGNRVSLTRGNGTASLLPNAVASATYNAANEQTSFAGATLTYDANGNLTNDGVNTYQWDARNRLIGISGNATATFNYDALGRRTHKSVNSLASSFLYDGNDIVAEVSGGAIGANYLRSLNIDEPFVRQASNGNQYYHTDALRSSLTLSDAQGNSSINYAYEPFGKTTISGNPSNRIGYTGRELDGDNFYHYRARYYSADLHRFISPDPIRFLGGDINLYSYVMNNPMKWVDPIGLTKIDVDIGSGIMTVDPEIKGVNPYQIPVSSGAGACLNDPSCAGRPWQGPIPPGQYTIYPNQISNPSRVGDFFRNLFSDWGDWRVPLVPGPQTNTFGRSGFFMHGGMKLGSAGCVDIGGGKYGDANTNRVLRDLKGDPDGRIPVTVR